MKHVPIRRDGKVRKLLMHEVAVGDLVEISAGMEVPFDAWVVSGNGIEANEY